MGAAGSKLGKSGVASRGRPCQNGVESSAVTGVSLMRGRVSRRTAAISWMVRVGMALGVVFDMTVKPDAWVAIVAVVVGAALGATAGVAARREVRPT